nr:putative ribonuclease H-like domain-containing protein [Tanacetum cinerariifolium]
MYSVDLKNVTSLGGLTCLFAKATLDEFNLWHKRLGHINFKTMNKLVKGNLVRGLPLKIFENNHTCVACQKGKQHKASCKTKTGYTQEEGIDYDEVFAPVARIKAIRLFLAYASFKDFVVYQMDVKSAFLYGNIEEEVYVYQPPGFEDPEFSDRVYKVEKALYGLHQAPRAWYEALSTYLLDNGFQRGQIDKTLFVKRVKEVSNEFNGRAHFLLRTASDIETRWGQDKFQVTPKVSHLHAVKRIFRYLKGQPKLGLWDPKDSPFDLEAYTDSDYVLWIQNKMLDYGYNFMNIKIFIDNESTTCIVKNLVFHSKTKHIEIRHHFIKDSYEKRLIQVIKIHTYKNVADFLTKAFDLTVNAVRHKLTNDIDVNAVEVHNMIAFLSKPDESAGFEQIIDFLSAHPIKYVLTVSATIYSSCIEQFSATAKVKHVNEEAQVHAKVDGKRVFITEASIRRDLRFGDEGDEAVYKETYDSVERAATTATGLDAKQDRGIISKTQFMATLNEPSSIGTSSGSGPRCQETIRDAATQTRVLDLETTKTAQAKKIANLKKRVKRLERKKKSRSRGLTRLYKVGLSARVESFAEEESLGEEESSKQGRIDDIDADDNITLVNDQEMFDADRDLQGEEVVARQEKEVLLKETQYVQNVVEKVIEDITTADIEETVSIAALITTNVTLDELTIAQALVEIKKSKPKGVTTTKIAVTIPTRPKAKGVIMQEPSEIPTTTTIPKSSKFKDKGKEKSRLFMELMDKRKKHFTKLRAEEQRRKPPTKAQKRNQMCVYLKNMSGFTHNQLKNKSFDEVQKEFDKTMSWIKLFVPMDSKVVKDQAAIAQDSNSKRVGDDLEQENAKKQRLEKENDSAELKRCLEIVPDDGDNVTIEATHSSSKSPTIVDYKIYKEGRKSYF